mmetsp:Transcript_7220/g.10741  ORF Transcript_7220/g.10741 Transcript_7220/m.10741 type:complete len:146 (-) Transcript_7220:12-449(-)
MSSGEADTMKYFSVDICRLSSDLLNGETLHYSFFPVRIRQQLEICFNTADIYLIFRNTLIFRPTIARLLKSVVWHILMILLLYRRVVHCVVHAISSCSLEARYIEEDSTRSCLTYFSVFYMFDITSLYNYMHIFFIFNNKCSCTG